MATRRQPLNLRGLMPGLFAATLLCAVALAAFLALWFSAPGAGWQSVFSDSYLWHVVRFSFWQASLSALILVFIPFPGSQLVGRVIDTFIALPTFLITLAFTFIYGSAGLLNGTLMALFAFELPPVDFLYSINGVILAEITVFTPLVMRPLMAGLRQIDKSQLEAASILGAHPLRVITQVIFPAALPALMAGGSLCLLLTTNEFGIVLFIGAKGVNTLPMMVYSKAILESDYSVACMIALINILLSLGLFMLYRLAAARTGVRS